MDWKIFFATFGAVFLAECADKTQLVGITMAARTGKPFTVWCGSVVAYIVITAFSVLLGALLARYFRPEAVRAVAGSLFIIIGILMLLGKV